MKTLACTLLILLATVMLSCSVKHEDHAQSQNEWKEMDDFHMLMAESFHPYKDSGNLQPARTHAAEMAGLADKWLHAPMPEKVDREEVKHELEAVKNKSDELLSLVNAKADSTRIGPCLDSLHMLFHHVMEEWYRSSGEQEEHHEGAHEEEHHH